MANFSSQVPPEPEEIGDFHGMDCEDSDQQSQPIQLHVPICPNKESIVAEGGPSSNPAQDVLDWSELEWETLDNEDQDHTQRYSHTHWDSEQNTLYFVNEFDD